MNLDNDVISCYKVDHQALFSYINWNHFRAGRDLDSYMPLQFSSVAQSCPTLRLHGPHASSCFPMLPCPSPYPGACSDSCPSSCQYHPAISSSVILFSSCPQSFPESGSFPWSQFFTSGGQSIGVSASA